MNNIIIDQSKCVKCRKCITICSSNVLSFEKEKVEISHPEFCGSCGHCAAICLEDAISAHPNNQKNPFIVKKISADLPKNRLLFHEKRSVREFKDQLLPNYLIKELIKYGEKAPSSENLRQRMYYVITDKNKIDELEQLIARYYQKLLRVLNPWVLKLISLWNKKTAIELKNLVVDFKRVIAEEKKNQQPVFRDAPCIICTAAPNNNAQSKDDCLAAQHYMMLYGHTQQIGSCIIGYAQYAHKKMERYLNVPKGYSIYAVTIFGYAKYFYEKEIEYTNEPDIFWD